MPEEILANSLLAKDTEISRLFGVESQITFTQVSGLQMAANYLILSLSGDTEIILTACLNLDMIFTLKYPFSRAKNLKR